MNALKALLHVLKLVLIPMVAMYAPATQAIAWQVTGKRV